MKAKLEKKLKIILKKIRMMVLKILKEKEKKIQDEEKKIIQQKKIFQLRSIKKSYRIKIKVIIIAKRKK